MTLTLNPKSISLTTPFGVTLKLISLAFFKTYIFNKESFFKIIYNLVYLSKIGIKNICYIKCFQALYLCEQYFVCEDTVGPLKSVLKLDASMIPPKIMKYFFLKFI